eukprot:TRINITY_DN21717_c0_g1_i1.p1 TRINITY_DN21717_c0_g1~~TRINITY_DN21717_c0_g1_i1.p1  ORF type:complete len:767 (-),score=117.22 TRINITY_DN21717_c0_g1_i1:56-2356(-)
MNPPPPSTSPPCMTFRRVSFGDQGQEKRCSTAPRAGLANLHPQEILCADLGDASQEFKTALETLICCHKDEVGTLRAEADQLKKRLETEKHKRARAERLSKSAEGVKPGSFCRAIHQSIRTECVVVPTAPCEVVNVAHECVETNDNEEDCDLISTCSSNNPAIENWGRLVLDVLEKYQAQSDQLALEWEVSDSYVLSTRMAHSYADIWTKRDVRHKRLGSLRSGSGILTQVVKFEDESELNEAENKPTFPIGSKRWIEEHLVMSPTSPQRTAWAAIGVFLMLYDIIALPLQVFRLPDGLFLKVMAWLSQIFWTFDIFCNFLTGSYVNTALVIDLKLIARSYARSWLSLDLVLVVPLWVILFLDGSGGQMAVLKYLRIIRFVRLLRLAKFDKVVSEALAMINSPVLLLSFGMAKLMVCMAITSHVNACMWFAIGDANSEGWVGTYAQRETVGVFYQYLCSLHWALTQFQGSSEIAPGSSVGERFYAVLCTYCSLLILSSFVSSLTNMMMQLQALHSEKTCQSRAVRGYLSEHKISATLSMRVKKYVNWKQKVQKMSDYDTVVFGILPTQLLMDLEDEVRRPTLLVHPFFHLFASVYPRLTRRLCHSAVQELQPAPDETVFSYQESCSKMYFLNQGTLVYKLMSRKGEQMSEISQETLNGGTFMSEPAMWTSWQHKGDLLVADAGHMLCLPRQEFGELMRTHPPAHISCILYAKRFVRGLQRIRIASDLLDPTVVALVDRSKQMFSQNFEDLAFNLVSPTARHSEKTS